MGERGHSSYRELFTELAFAAWPVWVVIFVAFIISSSVGPLDEPLYGPLVIGAVTGAATIWGIIRFVNRRNRKPPDSHPP